MIRHEMWLLFILFYPFVPCFGHIFLFFLWLVVESSCCVFSLPSKTSFFLAVFSHPMSFFFFLFPLLLCVLKVHFKINSSILQNHQPPCSTIISLGRYIKFVMLNWWKICLTTYLCEHMHVRENTCVFAFGVCEWVREREEGGARIYCSTLLGAHLKTFCNIH